MATPQDSDNGAAAVLVAIAVAIASYLPVALLIDRSMKWLHPIGHAEELMGRELAALFIGGPIGAAILAALAGWFTHRSSKRISSTLAFILIIAGALIAAATARSINLL